jgi:uncharacterized protein with LGFP repeats
MSSPFRAPGGAGLAFLAVFGCAGLARAQEPAAPPAADSPGKACGFAVGPSAMTEWDNLGGRDGRLGCPTADETASVPSSAGAQASETAFGDRGAILTYVSGPQAGKAFAVVGCAWRLFFSYGGAGGWLGLPTEDAQNTPDGQTQKFEGGLVTSTRASDSCDAEPTGSASESH